VNEVRAGYGQSPIQENKIPLTETNKRYKEALQREGILNYLDY